MPWRVMNRDGVEVQKGDELKDFIDNFAIFDSISKPPDLLEHGASEGRILVRPIGLEALYERYPSVYNCSIVHYNVDT